MNDFLKHYKMIYHPDPEIRKLEKQALKIDEEETKYLNYWYNSDFNQRTGDMAWWCYMGNLKEIIKKEKNNEQN